MAATTLELPRPDSKYLAEYEELDDMDADMDEVEDPQYAEEEKSFVEDEELNMAFDVDLDDPMLLHQMRKRIKERRESQNLRAQDMTARDEWAECCEMAVEAAAASFAAASAASAAARDRVARVRSLAPREEPPPGNCRILVKYPLGTRPIEMWVTLPSRLDVRPPELVECVSRQLARTKLERSRRQLRPTGLMLVDLGGGVLSVANTLAMSSVRPDDVLLLLPSAARLRFLLDETADLVAEIAAGEKKKTPVDDDDEPSSSSSRVQEEEDDSWGAKKDEDGLRVGEECWVELEGGWRRAKVASTAPFGVRTGVVLVRWARTSRTSMDEPRCAQVEVEKLRATLPRGAVVLDDAGAEDAESPPPRLVAISSPRALRADNSLRVQIIWRLGNPAEALAAWLRAPPPYGDVVKPRALMRKFARKLASEREKLQYRVVASRMCLATLDGTPLDERVPVATSLAAIATRRARATPESGTTTTGDAFEDEWRSPPPEAEETLIAMPRVDEILGVESPNENPFLDEAHHARKDRTGWIIEPDGTLTACTLLCGKSAPVRNRLASTSSPSLQVALASLCAATADEGSELANDDSTRRSAVRINGGDAVLVETDRRSPGAFSRLRQVKLSQIVFADELKTGVGPYARRPTSADYDAASGGSGAWYDERAAERDVRSIDDVRDKLLLQSVLPEFRRNGKLVAGGRKRLRRGEVVDLVFPYTSLGISVALAEEARPSSSSSSSSGSTKNAANKPLRKAIVVDAIGPSCPPRAQLALSPGDELVYVDEVPVEATMDGYQAVVAKLRCGARPIALSFRKAKDNKETLPPAPYPTLSSSSPPLRGEGAASYSVEENGGSVLRGSIATTRAVEVAVVDLTEDDCVDADLDDDDDDDDCEEDVDNFVKTLTPRTLAREQNKLADALVLREAEENEEESLHQIAVADLDDDLDDLPEASRADEPAEADAVAPSPVASDFEADVEEEPVGSAAEEGFKKSSSSSEPLASSVDDASTTTRGYAEAETVEASGDEEAAERTTRPPRDDEPAAAADLDDCGDEEVDDDHARHLVPIARSEDLMCNLPADIPEARAHRIPYERTPRPMQPLSANVDSNDDYTLGALLEPASPLENRVALREEPVESPNEIHFCVYDREGSYRACLCADGSVRNNRDELLGYLNLETSQAGSATEDFLGELCSESPVETELHLRGPFDELCGIVDLSKARLKTREGSTIIELTRSGEVISNDGMRVGRVEPFGYRDLKAVALYATFLDPGFISSVEVRDEDPATA